jgi:phosphoglycolate phosphatase
LLDKLSVPADSILFDLDGTLWDSTAVCANAWQSVINTLDYSGISVTPETIRSIAGMQHDQIFPSLLPHLSAQQCEALTQRCGQQELVFIKLYGAQLFDNVIETITVLSKDYPLFIVSNCQAGYIEAFLSYYQLENYFTDFECSGRTLKSKTENINAVMDRNKLKSPVYVGDTQGDCDAAYANQIPFIYAAYGFGTADRFTLKINTLTELTQTITPNKR